ncbi:MAG: sigma-70 family RNA polymerase sigma factor [Actinomycetota bacterium]|nr:sigma-70 family RNA polymerase sigma factor [Actinomycetota bacterium]
MLTRAQNPSTERRAAPVLARVDRASMSLPEIPAGPASMDRESGLWLERLRVVGPERDAALTQLHALLLRAARFEVGRRHAGSAHLRGGDQDDLAQQSADDALVAILGKLDDFRGESRFTTWAYKFALYEAAAKVRKRAWQGREIPLEAETWPLIADDHQSTPEQGAETAELLAAVQDGIESQLTRHQREVLVAIALNDVPIDVLAERLNTTRGALYKTIHDARQKLRTALAAQGLSIDEHRSST